MSKCQKTFFFGLVLFEEQEVLHKKHVLLVCYKLRKLSIITAVVNTKGSQFLDNTSLTFNSQHIMVNRLEGQPKSSTKVFSSYVHSTKIDEHFRYQTTFVLFSHRMACSICTSSMAKTANNVKGYF